MAVIGWIDSEEVTDEVRAIATSYNQTLNTKQTEMIERVVLAVYNEIVGVLVGRGFTLAQINTWARRGDYQRDISLCWSLKKIGFKRGDEQNWIDDFCDKADELTDVNLVDESGIDIEPAGEPEENFAVFDLEEINEDLSIMLP